MASPTVAVTFQAECSCTRRGEQIFVVGSADALGAWNPRKALPCKTNRNVFPVWTSEAVHLPVGSEVIEFKLFLRSADNADDKPRWESGPNKALHLPKSLSGEVKVTCSWELLKVKVLAGSEAAHNVNHTDAVSRTMQRQVPLASLSAEVPLTSLSAEAEDTLPELPKPEALFGRQTSGSSSGSAKLGRPTPQLVPPPHLAWRVEGAETIGRKASKEGAQTMGRKGSRHLCMTTDGDWNQEMSRTPSMMLIDFNELEEEAESHSKELDAMEERARLNKMMRRMPSGALIEQMARITDHADPSKTFMLQGFNWESWRAGGGDWYGVLAKKVEMLAGMGFTDVWLPPCSASVAPQGYLPSQLFNLDSSKYGSQASLEALLEKLHDHGIRGLADIVVNHRCGDKQDSQGRWNQFTSGMCMTKRPSFAGVMDWGGWAITLGDQFSDGTGKNGPGHLDGRFDAAPDIDHRNTKVQESINIWLRWLRLQVGFDGWRFDFVKGYGAEFVGLYCKKSEPAWAVGELWGDMQYDEYGLSYNQDKHRQDLINWINATDKRCTAFDFTTKGILQEACRHDQYWRLKDCNGKPSGLIGWMPKRAVTFIDNHDTGSTQRHWPFPDDKVLIGYAYILTHPGIPCVFWDHVMDWGSDHRQKIGALMKARQDADIPVDAKVNIQCAEEGFYLAEIGSPPSLRVALGRRAGEPDMNYWSHGPSGKGYCVWVKKQVPKETPPMPAAASAASKTAASELIKKQEEPQMVVTQKEPVASGGEQACLTAVGVRPSAASNGLGSKNSSSEVSRKQQDEAQEPELTEKTSLPTASVAKEAAAAMDVALSEPIKKQEPETAVAEKEQGAAEDGEEPVASGGEQIGLTGVGVDVSGVSLGLASKSSLSEVPKKQDVAHVPELTLPTGAKDLEASDASKMFPSEPIKIKEEPQPRIVKKEPVASGGEQAHLTTVGIHPSGISKALPLKRSSPELCKNQDELQEPEQSDNTSLPAASVAKAEAVAMAMPPTASSTGDALTNAAPASVETQKPGEAAAAAERAEPGEAAKATELDAAESDFEPLTVNGQKLTAGTLQAMSAAQLQSLHRRLKPLITSLERALAEHETNASYSSAISEAASDS